MQKRIYIAAGHSYTSVVTPPTENEKGYTTYTCSTCKHSYISDFVYVGDGVAVTGTVSFRCSSSGAITVVSPETLADEIGKTLRSAAEKYNKQRSFNNG